VPGRVRTAAVATRGLDRCGLVVQPAAMPIDFERYRIKPGKSVDLDQYDPGDRRGFDGDKEAGLAQLAVLAERLDELQEALYAESKRRLLVVLQAMDAGGKDGTIRAVFSRTDPLGVRVQSFGVPTELERAHDFLWRIHAQVPAKGEIAVFNRSHYEDVVVVRVQGLAPEPVWRKRFDHIVAFERMLHDEGTTLVKLFLHISKDEQRKRLQERLDDPRKHWKAREGDLRERRSWREYMEAYGEAIAYTSTQTAPWYVVPADRNWYRNLIAAQILVSTLEELNPQLPGLRADVISRVVE
jgi:PPK2 family polyphosphate:nucleotide phosphotransferase